MVQKIFFLRFFILFFLNTYSLARPFEINGKKWCMEAIARRDLKEKRAKGSQPNIYTRTDRSPGLLWRALKILKILKIVHILVYLFTLCIWNAHRQVNWRLTGDDVTLFHWPSTPDIFLINWLSWTVTIWNGLNAIAIAIDDHFSVVIFFFFIYLFVCERKG